MSVVRRAMNATAAAPAHAARLARNPGRYTKGEPVSAAVLIFLALVAIASLRKQAYPTWHEVFVYSVAAGVVALSAQIAPEFVTTLLVVALLAIVLGNAGLISSYTQRGFNAVNDALAAA